jgi:hypothetical protein
MTRQIQLRDGIPVNPRDMTVQDWKDLYCALEYAKERIRKRHENDNEGTKRTRATRRTTDR